MNSDRDSLLVHFLKLFRHDTTELTNRSIGVQIQKWCGIYMFVVSMV